MLITVSAAAIAACSVWLFGRSDDLSAWCGGLVAASLFAALIGACSSLLRHPVRLRWDSQCWYVTGGNRNAEEAGPSHVQVMLDAGDWLLLKFVPDGRSNLLAVRWLPVQRRGIEEQWHSLRCAVYSPRLEVTRPPGPRRPDPH